MKRLIIKLICGLMFFLFSIKLNFVSAINFDIKYVGNNVFISSTGSLKENQDYELFLNDGKSDKLVYKGTESNGTFSLFIPQLIIKKYGYKLAKLCISSESIILECSKYLLVNSLSESKLSKIKFSFEGTLGSEYLTGQYAELIESKIEFVEGFSGLGLLFSSDSMLKFPYYLDFNNIFSMSFAIKFNEENFSNGLSMVSDNRFECNGNKDNMLYMGFKNALGDSINQNLTIKINKKYYKKSNFQVITLINNPFLQNNKIKVYLNGVLIPVDINQIWSKSNNMSFPKGFFIGSFGKGCNSSSVIFDELFFYNMDISLVGNISQPFKDKLFSQIEDLKKNDLSSYELSGIINEYINNKRNILYDKNLLIDDEQLSKEKSLLLKHLTNNNKQRFLSYLQNLHRGNVLITSYFVLGNQKNISSKSILNPFLDSINEYNEISKISDEKLYADIALIYTSQYLMWLLFFILVLLLIYNYLNIYAKDLIFRNSFLIKRKIYKLLNKNTDIMNMRNFEISLKLIYSNMIALGFKINMSLLLSIIMGIKTRGLVVLLGRNGIGKTSLVETLVKSIYGNNYSAYFKKILVKQELNDERKLLGYYDRINNTYIDPYDFMKFILKAYYDKDKPYFLLLDEINMSDIQLFFPSMLQIDEILDKGESDFIKVTSIDFNDKKEISKSKYNLIKRFKFIVNENNKSMSIGFKIPSNLIVLGTANIDYCSKLFTGKLIDRTDFIWIEDFEGHEIGDMSIDKINLLSRNVIYNNKVINDDVIKFLSGIVQIMNLSKRVQKSMISYFGYTIQLGFNDISYCINQKILPLINGPQDHELLIELFDYLNSYKQIYDLRKSIKKIEKMLKAEYLSFWVNQK